MDLQAQFGARVRALRQRASMSQVRLAKALGVSPSYLNLIEHGRRRMPAELMFKVADALKVDVREFASATEHVGLHAEVTAALSDPLFDEVPVPADDAAALVRDRPAVARALVHVYRAARSALEAAERAGSLQMDGGLSALDASRLPSEEVNDFVQRNMNHFPALEEAAEGLWADHKLRLPMLYEGLERVLSQRFQVDVRIHTDRDGPGVVRRYDPDARVLSLGETLAPRSRHFHMAHQVGLLLLGDVIDELADDPQLTTDESRQLARMVLANYFAGALIMPYGPFRLAAEEERYDVELLGHRFRTSFEQVCHRLTCLRRPGEEGVPFHFIKTDAAGNVSKRFSASGIGFARFSGGCPKWNVYTVFQWPGRIRIQLSQMPDEAAYFCIARTIDKRHGGYHAPETLNAVGLGCKLEHAHRLVYADGLDLDRMEVVPIGKNCRICDRLECEARAFPSVRQRLRLDENTRHVAFYQTRSEGGL